MEWLCVLTMIAIVVAVGSRQRRQAQAKQLDGKASQPSAGLAGQGSAAGSGLTVTMRVGGQRSVACAPANAEFLIGDEAVEILGRRCPSPMFYISQGGGHTPPSYIDLSLRVAKRVPQLPPELPYWPSYAQMGPQHRASYLEWLAGGRVDPSMPLGYVFIFFYGLERRLISGHDIQPIRRELYRLLSIYGGNRSFHGYTTRLLIFNAMHHLDEMRESHLDEAFPLFDQRGRVDTEALRARLTWCGGQKRPLPWRLALAVALHDERSPKSVVLSRTREEFEALFCERYTEQFGDGFILQYLGRRTNIVYRPASSTLGYELERTGRGDWLKVSLNDPLSRARQFDALVELFSECVEQLRSYSRALGKTVDNKLTIEAWEKLPAELQAEIPHPNEPRWLSLISTYIRDDGWAHVPAGELSELCGITSKKRLSRDECRSVADTAAAMGFAVEPDPRIMPQSWKGDDRVVLMQLDEPNQHLTDDSTYSVIAVVLYMSVYIASADGVVDPFELEVIREHLLETFTVGPTERRRIDAACAALAEAELNMRGVAKLIEENLPQAQRERLAELLVDVALADGNLERDEETYLKRAYTALDLDPAVGVEKARARLEQRERELAAPVQVRAATVDAGAMAIPPRPVETPAEEEAPQPDTQPDEAVVRVQLDPERLAQTLRETRAVAERLSVVFAADGQQSEGEVEVVEESGPTEATLAAGGIFAELEPRYRPLLEELLTSPEWQPHDLVALADRHGLMVGGAIAAINTWSDEHLGDFLIEGTNPYLIYDDLLADLEES